VLNQGFFIILPQQTNVGADSISAKDTGAEIDSAPTHDAMHQLDQAALLYGQENNRKLFPLPRKIKTL